MERAELKNLVLIGLLTLAIAYTGWNGFVAFGWPGVSGLRGEAQKLLAERRRLEAEVQGAQLMVANLDKIKKERETLEVQLNEISKRLPSERESAEVLRNVETLAGKAGLTLIGVKRRPVRNQELYAEIPMEVTVGGNYLELIRFADQLGQLQRLVTLNEFNIQRALAAGPGLPPTAVPPPPGSVRAQMVALVFQALADSTPAAGAPGTPATTAPAAGAAPRR